MTCFDIGLSLAQKETAAVDCPNLHIVPLPETAAIAKVKDAFSGAAPLAKVNKRVWPLWLCPFLIAEAPYQRVFWLDCDIIVLRNLKDLFRFLDDGPVFTRENNAPEVTPNKPSLYGLLPIHRLFDPFEPRLNGGVSGWDLLRDSAVLDAYMFPILRACDDQRISEAISWHDQGALIWAVQKMGLQHRVLDSNIWNLCVRHTPLIQRPIAWGEFFLAHVREAVPSANLLHWNGTQVPWL